MEKGHWKVLEICLTQLKSMKCMEGSKENRPYQLQCLYGNPIANNFFSPKLNFAQFLNRNVKILGRRLYSPSLKDVAWLEDVQLIFLIFHTFVCKFEWEDKRLDAVRGKRNYRQMYGK